MKATHLCHGLVLMLMTICLMSSFSHAASLLSIFKADSWKNIQETNQMVSMCRFFIPSVPRNLATCTWYNSNSCCTVDTSQKIKAGWEKSSGRNSGTSNVTVPQFLVEAFAGGCLDELHQYICYLCSPGQTTFIEENIQIFGQRSTLYLCKSFCDRLYQKCALVPVTGGRPVSFAFSNGDDFCTRGLNDPANQLEIKVRTGNCFNKATALGVNWISMIVMVVISLIVALIHE
ncbi:hypothetical protein C9374_010004 [Naegleria lovaniensis]|uniref:Folate receptor-like domain-containing protein n=1 Tax=Naegleria lovaniensis TaxID=51637 RepID=A0AA88KH03_NAELO|nr:uncharacterized protein C9374_010004 [Naegleria lovaniensis]KAG2375381.1 hypothetical protein C9374_010004 [Naegleria lovaniensis]